MRERSVTGLSPRAWSRLMVLVAMLVLMSACGPPDDNGGLDSGADGASDGASAQSNAPPPPKTEAVEKFEQAVTMFKEQGEAQTDQVMRLLKTSVEIDPTFGEAWYNLGLLQEKRGQVDAAMTSYAEAITHRPKFAAPYVNLAMLHYHEKDDAAKAKELLLKVVGEGGFDRFHVLANLNLGTIYRLEGKEVVKRENEASIAVQIREGKAVREAFEVPQEAMKIFADAVNHYRQALQGDALNIASYENLAGVYYDIGELEVATLVCDQAIKKQSEHNADLAKRVEEGALSAEEAEQLRIPDVVMGPVYNTMGLIMMARGEVSLARVNFMKAIEVWPDFVDAKLNFAGIAINMQDFATARTVYEEVLALQPDNLTARLSLAVATRGIAASSGEEDYSEAERIYKDILQTNPGSAPTTFNLGVLYHEWTRDLPKAKETFERFVGLPDVAELLPVQYEDAKVRIAQISEFLANQAELAAEAAQQGGDAGGDDMSGDDMSGDDMSGDDMSGDDMSGDDMSGDGAAMDGDGADLGDGEEPM